MVQSGIKGVNMLYKIVGMPSDAVFNPYRRTFDNGKKELSKYLGQPPLTDQQILSHPDATKVSYESGLFIRK